MSRALRSMSNTRLLAVLLALSTAVPAGAACGGRRHGAACHAAVALEAHDPARYMSLLTPDADRDRAALFAEDWFRPGITRAVVRERDRAELPDAPSGRACEVYVDVLVEVDREGRLGRWRWSSSRTRRSVPAADDEWAIANEEAITTVKESTGWALTPPDSMPSRISPSAPKTSNCVCPRNGVSWRRLRTGHRDRAPRPGRGGFLAGA